MDLISKLPAAPHTLLGDGEEDLVLAFAESLATLNDGSLDFIARGAVGGAARGPNRGLYCTRADQVLRFDLEQSREPEDMTAVFGSVPQGLRRVVCMPDGSIWVEGCPKHRRLDGAFQASPDSNMMAFAPAPFAVDVYANIWSLADGQNGRQVLVLPANAPDAWQVALLEAGRWNYLVADSVGCTWVAGEAGLWRFCPRQAEAGWQVIAEKVPQSTVTALGLSPDDLVLAAFATGEVLELDVNAAGEVLVQALATTPSAGRCMHTDRDGAIWVATDDELYRCRAEADAWQQTWEKKPGRLPGGNHDIFSVQWQDKLYVAGGWGGDWGLPARSHVFDELFAYDWHSEYWEVVSHMPFPRRYNGIAELDGRIWIVGGEGELGDRHGDRVVVDAVDIYDPAGGTWTAGPSLNEARTDPFVMVCGGRIYAIGGAGKNSGPKLSTVESIGSGESAWRFETPLPEPTRQGHGCVLDGILYCVSIDGVFAFDLASGRWDEDLPQPGKIGQGPLAAAYRGEVWVIGGYEAKDIRCYDPETRSWRAGLHLPTEQAWGAATVMNGQLVIIGGAHHSRAHDTVVFDDRTYVLR